jgi:NitT/TauT family transport system substrate-binding protein
MNRCFFLSQGNGIYRLRVASVVVAIILLLGGVSHAGAQDQPLKVGVRLGDVSLNKLPLMVALDHGIYKKNGLDVAQLIAQSAADVVRNSGIIVPENLILKKGRSEDLQVDVGGASPMIVNLTTQEGAKNPVIVACTDNVIRTHILGRAGITKPEQLKGKRLGYTSIGTTTHFAAMSFAEAMGWNPRMDLSLIGGGGKLEGLQKGYVDAYVASELHETMGVAAGFTDVVDLSKYNMPNAGSSIMVDRTWLKNNREATQRLVKSIVEALALMNKDKKAATASMVKWLGLTDPKLQDYLYQKIVAMPHKIYPPVAGIKKCMEIYDSHEMRKYKPEFFYDDSFVRQLDQSGYIDSLYK